MMAILDWIYPKKCLGCGDVGGYLCHKCQSEIERRGDSLRYTGVVRAVIKEIKYRGTYDMVGELVSIWNPIKPEGDTLMTSVPMWQYKKRFRGYNQAELIGKMVARQWGVPYVELLKRVRETRPMYGLKRRERLENVKDAFEAKSQVINSQLFKNTNTVVLIDDVWTSGATMQECTRVLKQAGWKNVVPMALAS